VRGNRYEVVSTARGHPDLVFIVCCMYSTGISIRVAKMLFSILPWLLTMAIPRYVHFPFGTPYSITHYVGLDYTQISGYTCII